MLDSKLIVLGSAWLLPAILSSAMGCGPMVITDETTAAVGSSGSQTSSGSGRLDTGSTDTTLGETTEAGTTASESTGEVCGASGELDDCCCMELVGSSVDVTCPSTPLCDSALRVDCDGSTIGQFCSLGGAQVPDPTQLDCILEALVSSSVGHFDVQESADGGFSGRNYTIYLTGTQDAYMVTLVFFDLGGTYDEAPRLQLETPEYFMACQQEALAIDRYACMRHGIAEVVEECLPLPP